MFFLNGRQPRLFLNERRLQKNLKKDDLNILLPDDLNILRPQKSTLIGLIAFNTNNVPASYQGPKPRVRTTILIARAF